MFDADWLTPKEVREALGVSAQRLQQLVARGELHPMHDEKGVRRFTRTSVHALVERRNVNPDLRIKKVSAALVPGAQAAIVFELFDKSWDVSQIVQATKLPPSTVRALYQEYVTPLGQSPTKATPSLRGPRGRPRNLAPLDALLAAAATPSPEEP